MRRRWLLAAVCFVCPVLWGQNDFRPQFHGFVTQSFLYSGGSNNYLGMNTSSGSGAWTEAALNVNEQLSDRLRIGGQGHATRLGEFSDYSLDWALIDYHAKSWLGLRGGKVKIRWGLFNDTQDADPGYLWSLLPEPIYGIDWRATNLSQFGGEAYGRLRLPRRLGALEYSGYYGYYFQAPSDGYMQDYKESGIFFSGKPGGITPGFDLRWATPLKGVTAGGSLMMYNASGDLKDGGKFREPLTYWPTGYAQYDYKRFSASYQYMKLVQYTGLTPAGQLESISSSDVRAWFAMASYRVTKKLQAGAYYTRYKDASADPSDPDNYFRDWVISGRYEINSYFYAKIEGHFLDGAGQGFYGFNNPNGVTPQTKLLVSKIGFSF